MVIPDSTKLNPKADSFSLYLNYVANQILTNMLPKSKLENKLHKTIRDKTHKDDKVKKDKEAENAKIAD
jgi:hypothetical protein